MVLITSNIESIVVWLFYHLAPNRDHLLLLVIVDDSWHFLFELLNVIVLSSFLRFGYLNDELSIIHVLNKITANAFVVNDLQGLEEARRDVVVMKSFHHLLE